MSGIRITLEGKSYDYDGKLMLPEAIAVEKVTGYTQAEWEAALQKGSAAATAALIWILKKRAGEIGQFSDLNYDTHDMDVTFLRDDGTALDMQKVAAGIQTRIDGGASREEATRQVMAEQMKPAAVEPENPTPGPGGPPHETVLISTATSPPTPPPSPTTSVSDPGSSTG